MTLCESLARIGSPSASLRLLRFLRSVLIASSLTFNGRVFGNGSWILESGGSAAVKADVTARRARHGNFAFPLPVEFPPSLPPSLRLSVSLSLSPSLRLSLSVSQGVDAKCPGLNERVRVTTYLSSYLRS